MADVFIWQSFGADCLEKHVGAAKEPCCAVLCCTMLCKVHLPLLVKANAEKVCHASQAEMGRGDRACRTIL